MGKWGYLGGESKKKKATIQCLHFHHLNIHIVALF